MKLTTDLRLGFEGSRATARHMMKEGEIVYCALSWSEHAPPQDQDEAYDRLVWTAHHWQHWLDRGRFPDHPWRSYLQRSALTLKGLTYAPSGALLAAATTSLPETPQGERNWDYRYSWIRDSTFMLWALLSLGFDWEANDFFYFIADVASGDEKLQVMYGLDGERTARRAGARPPRGLRAGTPGADRQRRLLTGPARRLGSAAGLGLDPHALARFARRPGLEDALPPGRGGDRALAQPDRGNLGGSRRAAALHLLEDVLLGRVRPRLTAGGAARGPRARAALARGRRRDPRRHLRARRRRARRVRPALRHDRAGRVDAADAAAAVPAGPRIRGSARPCSRSPTS